MSLYTKMHAVMMESEGLEKKMEVGFGQNAYKAISESAVLNEIKPLLKKHGLVLFPIAIKVNDRFDTFTTSKGESTRMMTQVIAQYKIVDIDTGESEILETVGNGVDTQDKASGKALTYGYKALMQKTFCLFSGEDEENSDDITNKQTVTAKLITEDQAVKVANECAETGSDIKEVMKYFKLTKLDKMTETQFGQFEKMMTVKRSKAEAK